MSGFISGSVLGTSSAILTDSVSIFSSDCVLDSAIISEFFPTIDSSTFFFSLSASSSSAMTSAACLASSSLNL